MKTTKNIISFTTFFIIVFLFTMNVSAASGWSTGGYTKTGNGVYVLTEKYHTSQVGTVIKDVPVDTRSGFSISFDYWVGDVSNQPREGFQLIFTDRQPDLRGGSYHDMGYGDYFYYPEMTFRAVQFDSYPSPGNIRLVQNDNKSLTSLQRKEVKISDSTWHNIVIKYMHGSISVYRDEQLLFSQSGCYLPDITYLGFTAATSYWGTQTTKIQNINLQASEPSLISFHAAGGSVTPAQAYILRNSNMKLPTPVKYGNTFLGWYTSLTGGVKVSSANYNFAARQTLYAHWKDHTVKMTFDANKGVVSQKVKAVLPKSKIGALPTPVRNSYTFLGWYTKKNGGKKITSSTVITKNTTVYARWVSNSRKVKITLNKNGGSCKKSSLTVTCGGTLKGLPNATRNGYTFLGWYTAKNGGTRVYESTKTTAILDTKKLYAHWRKQSSSSGGSSGGNSSGGSSNCAICHGSRRCNMCGGSGYIYNYVTGKYNRNCTRCNTSGRCVYCR